MAWDVMSGVTKMAWDVMSGVTKTVWDVLSGVANLCGMFCPGCKKMAWDVLSRDVLSGSHILLISPFICSFFFLSNGNFCHRFLSSYWSQCLQILCTSSGWQTVLCKWKLRC